MLQPTPHLLVRPAASMAASLRLLTHQKLPLTPAESKSLLNALTTSFRHQLDQEHGESAAKASKAKSISGAKTLHDVKNRQGTHTESHLSNILTNPLFRPTPASNSSSARDPMDVFDRACAKGLMTPSRARACLIAKKDILKASPGWRAACRTGDSGAKVFMWLLSNGAKESSSWLLPPARGHADEIKLLPDIVFEFLVLEGREQVLWDLFEHHVVNRTQGAKVDLLLYHFSRTLARRGRMDAAYESLIKAKGILQEHGFSKTICKRVLEMASESLVRATFATETPARSDALFEDFALKAAATYSRHPIWAQRLALYHPSKPDVKPSLEYLASLPLSAPLSGAILFLALDTAKVLLKQDKHKDARWVMGFLEERCDIVGGSEVQNKYAEAERLVLQAESEERNLELLEGLNFGLRAT